MSGLPSGWEQAPLSKVCSKIVDGSHNPPKATDSGFPMLSARNIQDRRINFDDFRFISEEDLASEYARTNVEAGDVLLTIVGTIGRTAVVTEDVQPFSLQRSVAVLKPQGVLPKYLSYALESPKLQRYFQDNAKGTAQKGIYLKALADVEILLAPLNEQKRIAEKLDSLLARVDACRERLDRVPLILKRFRQAVLFSATSGALTEEWRGNQNLEGWQTVILNKICLSITDGDHQAPPQVEKGIPFITISAINDGRLNLGKATRYVPRSYYEQLKESRKPEIGDILFSVTGSIAIPALVDIDAQFTFQRHIAILKPNIAHISSKYLLYSLGTERIKDQALAVATGTAQLTIPLNGLRSFKIDLPPKEEQEEIVRRVETLFAFADRIEARYKVSRAQVDQLTPSLLEKAFRGELVPQDPNDEPATKLLEKIKMARAQLSEKPQRAKRQRLEPKVEAKVIDLSQIQANHLSIILKRNGRQTAKTLWQASQLSIEDFYEQLRVEEAKGLLREVKKDAECYLEAA